LSPLFGQAVNVRDFNEALTSGNVTLESANGTGYISTVTGRLRNNTRNEIQINVSITNGLYFVNSGAGQNMIAVAVYLEGNRFYRSGTIRYIILPANTTTNIIFVSLCADREKDAPKTNELLIRTNMPSNLQSIATRLSNYYAANYGTAVNEPIQLALWREQRESISDIAAIYNFTAEDWTTSSNILGLPPPPIDPIPAGTYSYSSRYSVTINGNNFTMNWEDSIYRGTYIRIDNAIILKATSGDYKGVFTIVNNGIQDRDGDLWRRR